MLVLFHQEKDNDYNNETFFFSRYSNHKSIIQLLCNIHPNFNDSTEKRKRNSKDFYTCGHDRCIIDILN